MATVGHCVEAEDDGVGLGREDRVREEALEHAAAAGAEGLGVVGDGGVVQDRQRGVEVVEARIHQLQRDHRDAEQLLRLSVGARVGAEAGARQDELSDYQEVSLALVHVHRLGHLLQVHLGQRRR